MVSKWSPKTSFLATPGPQNGPKCAKWAVLKTHQKNTFKKTPQRAKTAPKNEPNLIPNPDQKSLKNRPGAPSGKKGGPGGSRGAPGRENDTKIDEKTIHFDTEDMQKKASIPPCFSTVLGEKTGGTVPKKGEHSVFFFFYLFGVNTGDAAPKKYETIQYNTIQYKKWTWDLLHNFDVKIGGTAQR